MMDKEIRWTLGDGRAATIRVRVSEDLMLNGNPRPETAMIYVDGSIAGILVGNHVEPVAGRTDGVVARIGKIGIRQEQLDAYTALIAEAEADPQYLAYRAELAEVEKIDAEYREHVRRMDATMTLNGRSY